MLLPQGKRSTEWVKRLPDVVSALSNEVTSLIGKKPAVAIKEKSVSSNRQQSITGLLEWPKKELPPLINVRYLYQPGELEGGTKRATDPIWSLKVYQGVENKTKPNEPVVYYLSDGSKRGFVREELLVVPPNTQLPPARKISIHCFVSNGDMEILFMHIPYISWPSLLKIFILCINCFLSKSASL